MTSLSTVRDAAQARVARAALNLPPALQRRLAGPPVRKDGQELAVEVHLLLKLQELAGEPAIESLPYAEGRTATIRQAEAVGGDRPIGATRDLWVDGAAGQIRARLYEPARLLGATTPAGLLVYVHGGGFVYGDLDSHDAACRFLAEQAGVRVLAVDYRLAPEHRFPAALDDAAAAYAWAVAHADELHADPAHIGIGGDSAGGHLAASTAIAAAEAGLPCAFQLLIYPVTEFVEQSASRRMFADGFFLTSRFMDQCTEWFFDDVAEATDPRASILRRTSFPDGLAPAYVATAGFDPLRDEGEAYADLLERHGVPVHRRRFPALIHGFHNMVGAGRAARAANREVAAVLAEALR